MANSVASFSNSVAFIYAANLHNIIAFQLTNGFFIQCIEINLLKSVFEKNLSYKGSVFVIFGAVSFESNLIFERTNAYNRLLTNDICRQACA